MQPQITGYNLEEIIMPILTLKDANGVHRNNIIFEPVSPNGRWIIAIHGGYSSPEQMRTSTALELLFSNHYICYAEADKILPDGNGNLVYRGWRSNGNDKTDVRFLNDLTDEFTKQYNLSYENGGIIGPSNGGMIGSRLAAVLDEMGIGFLVMISSTYTSPETFDFKGRVLMINSINDKIVPYKGNAIYKSVEESITYIRESAVLCESVILNDKVSDEANFNYHTWDEIRSLYPNLEQRIVDFVEG